MDLGISYDEHVAKTKVLYVAGYERSGSTVFHNVLGQIDTLWASGEVRQLWSRALMQERPCGCSIEPLRECPFWHQVLTEAFGSPDNTEAERWYAHSQRCRNRHFPLLLLPGGPALMKRRMDGYLGTLGRLYAAIQNTGGGEVIVDSSKSPAHAWLLATVPNIDVFVIHLVRDPRGVVNSVLKRKRRGQGHYVDYSLRRTVAEWAGVNLMVEQLNTRFDIPYRRVRYEDFTQAPVPVLESMLDWLGAGDYDLPFVDERTVRMTPTHTAAGSPHRFSTGSVQLREDTAWRSNLSPSEIERTEWWAHLLMKRYRYEVGGTATAPAAGESEQDAAASASVRESEGTVATSEE
jgi:hypothetical protein